MIRFHGDIRLKCNFMHVVPNSNGIGLAVSPLISISMVSNSRRNYGHVIRR